MNAYRWEDGFPPLPLYPFPPYYTPIPTSAQPRMSESCRLKDSEESWSELTGLTRSFQGDTHSLQVLGVITGWLA